jgi:hypothetical protein
MASFVRAFSSKVDPGLRRENAIKQRVRAPIQFNRIGNGSKDLCQYCHGFTFPQLRAVGACTVRPSPIKCRQGQRIGCARP